MKNIADLWSWGLFGKKRLGVKLSGHLELVRAYNFYGDSIPFFFKRRILLYDFSNKIYYEFHEALEKKLLALGRRASQKELKKTIRDFSRFGSKGLIYYPISS